MTLEERVLNLEKLLLIATARIKELEEHTGLSETIERRNELKDLKAKLMARGMSSNQARRAAWKELNPR